MSGDLLTVASNLQSEKVDLIQCCREIAHLRSRLVQLQEKDAAFDRVYMAAIESMKSDKHFIHAQKHTFVCFRTMCYCSTGWNTDFAKWDTASRLLQNKYLLAVHRGSGRRIEQKV